MDRGAWWAIVQFSSVAQSCLTLCYPMDCSKPGLPVHHQLPEFTQTHVHKVGDAIQPSHPVIPFSSCLQSFPSSGSFQMSHFFALTGHLSQRWSFSFSISPSNEYSGLISFRIDWFDLLAGQGTQESSPAPQFKSVNPSALSSLWSNSYIHT